MADEPTPTPNSEPTPTPAPSEPPAGDPPAPAPAQDEGGPAPKQDEGDDLAGLSSAGDEAPKPDPAAVVPETYELTTPEGFEKLDDTAIAAATPVFKELGLSNEQANKLIPVVADYAKRIVSDRDQLLMGTIMSERKAWFEDAKAAPDIGGANWDETMRLAAAGMDRLGYPKGSSFRGFLEESGLQFHPDMIRFVSRVGKAIGEDSDFVRGDANVAVKPKTDAELFYGKKG